MSKKNIVIFTLCWLLLIPILLETLFASRIIWKMSFLEPYIIGYELDSWTHVAFEIERIKKHKKNETNDHFVFLSGSAGLAAITNDKIVSDSLSRSSGKEIGFTSLNSSYKSFSDEMKIVETVGSFSGTFIIPVEMYRFGIAPHMQFTKYSEALDVFYTKYYHMKTSDSVYEIIEDAGFIVPFSEKFYLSRTLKVFGENIKHRLGLIVNKRKFITKVYHNRNLVNEGDAVDKKKEHEIIEDFGDSIVSYHENIEFNLRLLAKIIDVAKANGNKVVLLEFPVNEIFNDYYNIVQEDYELSISTLVEEKDVKYLDMRDKDLWTPEDFRDAHHMRAVGSEKFTDLIIKKLSEGDFY